jgi:hypothetical protein
VKRFWEGVARLQEHYCCAWCRGRLVAWMIFAPAILVDKWPGFVACWAVAVSLSFMAYRKHKKDHNERMRLLGR